MRRLLVSRLLSRKTKLRIWNAVLRPMVLYGCESWSLTARDRSRLLVFENRVLRTILGPAWDPVTGQPRLRNNRDIRNLTGQPQITSVIRSKRLQWAGHVRRGGSTKPCTGERWGDGPRLLTQFRTISDRQKLEEKIGAVAQTLCTRAGHPKKILMVKLPAMRKKLELRAQTSETEKCSS